MRRAVLSLVLLAAPLSAAVPVGTAAAEPAGRTTLEETIELSPGTGFRPLASGPGERYVVRENGLGRAVAGRSGRRRSLAFFGQLTDPQLADEMSPARVEFLDPRGDPFTSAFRPQEAMGPHIFDQTIRNMNRNRTSRVRQRRGARQRLQFAVTTGDLADNQQLNEVRWYVHTLEGGQVDPFSGKPVGPANPCPGATPSETERLNDDVANRRYTGVQDYDDYPAPTRYRDFYDPDEAPPAGSPYAAFPRYPGLMDRAQRPFAAEGLAMPWFTSRGNHDGLVQGNVPASPLFASVATSCIKVFPSESIDPSSFASVGDVAEAAPRLLNLAGRTPPDPDRRFVDAREFKRLHGSEDRGHGYANVAARENAASGGAASYYAYSPRPGFRFIGLDTVAEGGGDSGNLDDPQYDWLARELDRNSSTEVRGGRVVRDGDPDRLIVLYGHHSLVDLDNSATDEAGGAACGAAARSCDPDPRSSSPVHRGVEGSANVRDLLLRHPNVVSVVSGHSHENQVTPYRRSGGTGGFWNVETASHIDFPQQSRTLEVMDNRDGTLSIFGTVLDHAAPIGAPPSGTTARRRAGARTAAFSDLELSSIGRQLAANDPQRGGAGDGSGSRGARNDRNVELLVRDPRRLAADARRRAARRSPRFTG